MASQGQLFVIPKLLPGLQGSWPPSGSPLMAWGVSGGPETGQGTLYGLWNHFFYITFTPMWLPGSWPPPGSPLAAGDVSRVQKWVRALHMDCWTTFCFITFTPMWSPVAPQGLGLPQGVPRWPGLLVGVGKRVRALHFNGIITLCFKGFTLKSKESLFIQNSKIHIFPFKKKQQFYTIYQFWLPVDQSIFVVGEKFLQIWNAHVKCEKMTYYLWEYLRFLASKSRDE